MNTMVVKGTSERQGISSKLAGWLYVVRFLVVLMLLNQVGCIALLSQAPASHEWEPKRIHDVGMVGDFGIGFALGHSYADDDYKTEETIIWGFAATALVIGVDLLLIKLFGAAEE